MSLSAGSSVEQRPHRILTRLRATGLALAGVLGLGVFGVSAPAALAQTVSASSLPNGEITISGPDTVVPGTPATYTATITNPDAITPTEVFVSGSMEGASFQRIANCPSAFGGGGNQPNFACTAPILAPGASESLNITINASMPGTQFLVVGFAFFDASGSFDGENAELPVTVQTAPTDVQVTGSSNNGSPSVGSQFTYTFQVKNNGPNAASGVTFDDTLPASIRLAGSGSEFSGFGVCREDSASNSVHCDVGPLGVGQQVTIPVPAIATATGAFANTATVGMSGTDSRPDNNSVTVTVQPR